MLIEQLNTKTKQIVQPDLTQQKSRTSIVNVQKSYATSFSSLYFCFNLKNEMKGFLNLCHTCKIYSVEEWERIEVKGKNMRLILFFFSFSFSQTNALMR